MIAVHYGIRTVPSIGADWHFIAAIAVVGKDVLPAVASGHNVVEGAGILETDAAGHGRKLTPATSVLSRFVALR
jgi:hypothetical protein